MTPKEKMEVGIFLAIFLMALFGGGVACGLMQDGALMKNTGTIKALIGVPLAIGAIAAAGSVPFILGYILVSKLISP